MARASGDRATEAAIACLDAKVPGWVASSASAAAARLAPLERRLARSPPRRAEGASGVLILDHGWEARGDEPLASNVPSP